MCRIYSILKVFLKEYFEETNFEKSQQTTKNHEKLASMQRDKNEMIQHRVARWALDSYSRQARVTEMVGIL